MEDKILELMRLCLEVDKTKASTFMEYAGHVDSISVRVYTDGYTEDEHADYSKFFYTTGSPSTDVTDDADEIIDDLKEMLEVD